MFGFSWLEIRCRLLIRFLVLNGATRFLPCRVLIYFRLLVEFRATCRDIRRGAGDLQEVTHTQ